jgi:hypothetical protein
MSTCAEIINDLRLKKITAEVALARLAPIKAR